MAKHYSFPVGTQVGVIRGVSLQGVYTVTKINGNVCEITRDSDGYVRTFSNRNGCEKHQYGTDPHYSTAELLDIDRYEQLVANREKQQQQDHLWKCIAEAAARKNLAALQDLTSQLEKLVTKLW